MFSIFISVSLYGYNFSSYENTFLVMPHWQSSDFDSFQSINFFYVMQQLTLNVSTVYHVITNLELHTVLVWFSLIISCICIMATNTTRTHAHSSPLNTLLLIPYNKLQNTRRPSQQQRPEKGGGNFGLILAGFYGDNSGCWLQRCVCYQQLDTMPFTFVYRTADIYLYAI